MHSEVFRKTGTRISRIYPKNSDKQARAFAVFTRSIPTDWSAFAICTQSFPSDRQTYAVRHIPSDICGFYPKNSDRQARALAVYINPNISDRQAPAFAVFSRWIWFKHILFHKVYMGTNIMWKCILKDQNESNITYLVLLLNNNNCEKKANIMYKWYSELLFIYIQTNKRWISDRLAKLITQTICIISSVFFFFFFFFFFFW